MPARRTLRSEAGKHTGQATMSGAGRRLWFASGGRGQAPTVRFADQVLDPAVRDEPVGEVVHVDPPARSAAFAARPRARLIFGYGSADERAIDQGVRRLAGVLESVREAPGPTATAGSARRPRRAGGSPPPGRSQPLAGRRAGGGGRTPGRARP